VEGGDSEHNSAIYKPMLPSWSLFLNDEHKSLPSHIAKPGLLFEPLGARKGGFLASGAAHNPIIPRPSLAAVETVKLTDKQ
jgi:hypothetical protein